MALKARLTELVEAAETEVAILVIDEGLCRARLAGFDKALCEANGDAGISGIVKRIQDKKDKESEVLAEITKKVISARGRLSAYQEALKLFPRANTELREGSQLAKARDVLRREGKPMTVGEILTALGLANDESKRNSLRGSLSRYARDGRVFTKENAPDTFGLIELNPLGKYT